MITEIIKDKSPNGQLILNCRTCARQRFQLRNRTLDENVFKTRRAGMMSYM